MLIVATIGTVAMFALWSGLDLRIALFSGMVVATNSTSIAIKTLLDRAETDTPIGRMTIWIQIFGDLCVIPFILLVPLLAGQGDVGAGGIAVSFAKALLIIVLIFLAARWALPRVLEYIVAAKSREMFIISVITICFGTAMLTFYSGLPLTLGALIAGLVISESEYAAQTISDMIPMTESFVALFFVSVGMLINLDFFTGNFALIAGLAVLVIAVKIIINGASLLISKLSLPHVIRTSFYVAQIGEFSFVLAFSALTYGLISRYLPDAPLRFVHDPRALAHDGQDLGPCFKMGGRLGTFREAVGFKGRGGQGQHVRTRDNNRFRGERAQPCPCAQVVGNPLCHS